MHFNFLRIFLLLLLITYKINSGDIIIIIIIRSPKHMHVSTLAFSL